MKNEELIKIVEEKLHKKEIELHYLVTELEMLKTKRDEQRKTNNTLQEV